VLDELVPSALHTVEQYANNPIEADHGRLKARLRLMHGLLSGLWPVERLFYNLAGAGEAAGHEGDHGPENHGFVAGGDLPGPHPEALEARLLS